jgi:hypothetical protein
LANDITYHWGNDHLRIDLGQRLEPRIRVLFWAELVLTCGMASTFLAKAFPFQGQWIHWATFAGAATLYLLAAWRFLSRMAYREQLIIENAHFTIIQTTFFKKQVQRFLWTDMGHLHYACRDKKTDHPLKGKHFDYWGFDTQEHLIQRLYQEGNLYFNYDGYMIRFGRNIYSWHAEEIVRMIRLYAGERLHLSAEWRDLMQEHEWDDNNEFRL